MFDLDVSKLLVVGAVALIVIGPKDMPRVLRTVGQVVGRMRRMTTALQNQFAEAIKEVDLDGVKTDLSAIRDQANIGIAVNSATAMRGHLLTAVEGSKAGDAPTESIYASPEMKAYLAPEPEAPAGEVAALTEQKEPLAPTL